MLGGTNLLYSDRLFSERKDDRFLLAFFHQ
jgi:hypothetical protein